MQKNKKISYDEKPLMDLVYHLPDHFFVILQKSQLIVKFAHLYLDVLQGKKLLRQNLHIFFLPEETFWQILILQYRTLWSELVHGHPKQNKLKM